MLAYLNTYRIYSKALAKIKARLKYNMITVEEAKSQAQAAVLNLKDIIPTFEFVYPDYLVGKLEKIIDDYQNFIDLPEDKMKSEEDEICIEERI